MPKTDTRRRAGFTFAEALVAFLLFALIVIVWLPAVRPDRIDRRVRTRIKWQLFNITSACESYRLAFNASPGYVGDDYFNKDTAPAFTASENLVLGLLGGVVEEKSAKSPIKPRPKDFPADRTIDVDKVGTGPATDAGKKYGAFYSPKPGELATVTGTTGDDNNMPELVDPVSGMPILYYRAAKTAQNDALVADWYDGAARIGRLANGDSLNATKLRTADGDAHDQSKSLLNAGAAGAGDAATANHNLSMIARDRQLGDVLSGNFVLMSAGPDGVYFDKKQIDKAKIETDDDVTKFDDVAVTGG